MKERARERDYEGWNEQTIERRDKESLEGRQEHRIKER